MKPPHSPFPGPLGLGAVMLAVLRREIALAMRQKGEVLTPLAVSYTHLTLPTSDLV